MATTTGAPSVANSKRRRSQATAKKEGATKRPVKAKAAAKAPVSRQRNTGAVIPYLTVMDATASLAFYAQAFGFKPGVTMSSPDGKLIHAVMHFRGAVALMFSPEGIWSGTMKTPAHSGAECPITIYVRCPKVDALADRARAAEAPILTEPTDMFWGDRIARIADPDGCVWCFASKIGQFDPAKTPAATEESAESDFDFQF